MLSVLIPSFAQCLQSGPKGKKLHKNFWASTFKRKEMDKRQSPQQVSYAYTLGTAPLLTFLTLHAPLKSHCPQ